MTATTDTPRTNKASALEPAAGHCPKCFQSLASAQMRNQYRKQLAAARTEADELARRCIQKALPVFASTFCTPDDLIARVRAEMEKEKGNG